MDPLSMLIIGGIIAGISQGFNQGQQQKANEADREAARKLYEQQREDNLENFHRVNEYNHPRQQMIRLKEAGLNPNLVYGSGANMPSAKIDTATQELVKKQPLQVDMSQITGQMGEYERIRNLNEQTNNLQKQNEVMQQEILLKQAQTGKTMEESATTKFQRMNAEKFQDTLFQKANLDNQLLEENIKGAKLSQEIGQDNLKTNQLAREKVTQEIITQKLQNSKTELEKEKIREDLKLLQKENTLKQIEIELRKQGIMPNTKTYERVIIEALNNPQQAVKYGASFVKNSLKAFAKSQWGYYE